MSSYPADLPGPVSIGHEPKSRNFVTDLQGPTSYSNRERDLTRKVALQFFFTAAQAEIFYLWWRDDLNYGGRWFNCEWPSLQPGPMVVQFLEEPDFDHVYGGAHRISISAAVRGSSLPVTACLLDAYYNNAYADPYWHRVVFLISSGTGFTDSSTYGRTVTAEGGATASSATKRFEGSLDLSPYGARASLADAAELSLARQAWTFECWVNRPSSVDNQWLYSHGDSAFNYFNVGLNVYINPAGLILGFFGKDGNSSVSFGGGGATAVPAGTWAHIAVCRDPVAGSVKTFLNGEMINSTSVTGAFSINDSTSPAVLGYNLDRAVYPLTGYMEDARMTVGAARYASSFTAPIRANPTSPLVGELAYDPYWAQVVMLLRFNNETGFRDSSSYGRTMTATGAVISLDNGALGGASALFDGVNDYVTTPGSSAFALGTSDFCIEARIRPDSLSGTRTIITNRISFGADYGFMVFTSGTLLAVNTWGPTAGTPLVNINGGVVAVGVWQHVRFTRKGSAFALYLDGVQVASGSSAITVADGGLTVFVGRDPSNAARDWVGRIEEVRVTIGEARNDAAFTPPTLQHPATGVPQHTILALHGETLVDSSSEPKALTNIGSVATSESARKFGKNSIYFNGSSQYLKVPVTQEWLFSTSDFAVEAWINPELIAGKYRPIFTFSETITANFNWFSLLAINSDTTLIASSQPSGAASAVSMVSAVGVATLDSWQHIVFAKKGTAAHIFHNGVRVAAAGNFVNWPDAELVHIGIGAIGNGYVDGSMGRFQGYLDDLRVTKGVARYFSDDLPLPEQHPTAAPADPFFSSVYLLVSGNSSLLDQSSYGRTGAATGGVAVSAVKSKFGGSSVLYPAGSASYTWSHVAAWNDMLLGDFTVELWAWQAAGSFDSLIAKRAPAATGWSLTGSGLRGVINGAYSDTQMYWYAPAKETWHHYALVRKGSVLAMFIDGRVISVKHGVTQFGNNSSDAIHIGSLGTADQERTNGYFDDIRISMVARYDWQHGSFKPPAMTFCDR